MPAPWTLLALAPLVAPPFVSPVTATRAPLGPEGLYQRALTRALERSQADLLVSLNGLWQDHSKWESPWIASSEHYEVRTTDSYTLAAYMAGQLEYMRGEMVKLLGEGSGSNERLPIWILPNLGAFNTVGAQAAEHSSMYGSFYADQVAGGPVATYYVSNRTLLGMWVTHGAVHQFLERSFGVQPPTWVAEGLASYFALYWDWGYGAKELKSLGRNRTYVPIERLVRDGLPAYVNSADQRFIELGMLFHYLLNYCESTRIGAGGDPATGPFRDFLRLAVRGQDTERTEFAKILEEDASSIESDFKGFDFPE